MIRSKTIIQAFSCGLLAAAVFAQSPEQSAKGTISGSVRATAAGGISSIEIEVWDEVSPAAITWDSSDREGDFSIELPSGRYYLVANTDNSQPGWSRQRYAGLPCTPDDCDVRLGTPVDLAAGERVEGLRFELEPGGRISGSVSRASDGTPVSSGSVQFWTEDGYHGVTAEVIDGRYLSPPMPAGVYFATAGGTAEEVGQLYGGASYCQDPLRDSTCDPRSGRPIRVVTGSEATGVDFQLRPGGFLSGRVTLPGGAAAEGRAFAVGRTGDPIRSAELADGGFRIGPLAPGAYLLEINAQDAPWQLYHDVFCHDFDCDYSRAAVVDLGAGEHRAGLDVRLHELGSLSGAVESRRDGARLAQATVYLYPAGSRRLFRTGGTDNEGQFSFEDLPPGLYYLAARHHAFEGQLYDGAVFPDPAEPQDLDAGTTLMVPEGGSLSGLTLRLSELGRLEGSVVEETGAPLAGVELMAHEGEDPVYSAFTGEDGTFSLPLAAGVYYLTARGEGQRSRVVGTEEGCPRVHQSNGPACDPRRGQAFTVKLGRRTAAGTIELGRPGRLRGNIALAEGPAGEPVYARVLAYSREGRLILYENLQGEGAASFDIEVPAGRYFLEVHSAFYAGQLYSGVDCPSGPDDVFVYSCPNPKLGTPIDLGPGEERDGLDFSLRLDRSPCESSVLRLCLGGGRFSVVSTIGNQQLPGILYATQLTRDSGMIGSGDFGLPSLVKVLDGCRDFGHFWVFAQGIPGFLRVRDRFAATSKIYNDPEGPSWLADLAAFATCDTPLPAPSPASRAAARTAAQQEENPPMAETCGEEETGPDALCLLGRFRVEAEWQSFTGARGVAKPLAIDDKTGAFSFFAPGNLELMVWMKDTCSEFRLPRFWVHAGGVTDVAVELTVTDTRTGARRSYFNPLGVPFGSVLDYDAFATCD